jgi:hypothetical protein
MGPFERVSGRDALRVVRATWWEGIKGRTHELHRVLWDAERNEAVLFGTAQQSMSDGKEVGGEWVGRMTFAPGELSKAAEDVQMCAYQVWIVSPIVFAGRSILADGADSLPNWTEGLESSSNSL